MNILHKLFSSKDKIDTRLVGEWQGCADNNLVNDGETTKMIFSSNGTLTYQIIAGSKLQQMNLTFYTKGDQLFSNQPSHLKLEETKYWFEGDSHLFLEYDGVISKYIKC